MIEPKVTKLPTAQPRVKQINDPARGTRHFAKPTEAVRYWYDQSGPGSSRGRCIRCDLKFTDTRAFIRHLVVSNGELACIPREKLLALEIRGPQGSVLAELPSGRIGWKTMSRRTRKPHWNDRGKPVQ